MDILKKNKDSLSESTDDTIDSINESIDDEKYFKKIIYNLKSMINLNKNDLQFIKKQSHVKKDELLAMYMDVLECAIEYIEKH